MTLSCTIAIRTPADITVFTKPGTLAGKALTQAIPQQSDADLSPSSDAGC